MADQSGGFGGVDADRKKGAHGEVRREGSMGGMDGHFERLGCGSVFFYFFIWCEEAGGVGEGDEVFLVAPP